MLRVYPNKRNVKSSKYMIILFIVLNIIFYVFNYSIKKLSILSIFIIKEYYLIP